MEEDDISKIAEELKEAASTDVTEGILQSFPKDVTTTEMPGVSLKPPVPIESLINNVAGMNIDTTTSAAAVTAGHSTTKTTDSTTPQLAGDHDLVTEHKNQDQSASEAPQTTPHNPYRATTALNTHVPATSMMGNPNIFMPPAAPTQQNNFTPYNNSSYNNTPTQPQQQQPTYPNFSTYQQNNSAKPYNNSTQQPRSGEAFLEISTDPMNPGWTQQPSYEHYHNQEGLMGWFSNVGNKVFEKTKSGVETMITTLDPGMKSVIYSGGEIDIVVTTSSDDVVDGVRIAFQEVFGKATVTGMESRSDIASQPVGFPSGLKGAENRIENLRRSVSVHERQTLVSVEFFIHEILPEKWYDIACIHLKDPMRNIDITLFSQATPLNAVYVQQAQDTTPKQYDLRWSGLSVTVGEVINRAFPHIHPLAWHKDVCGVSRRDVVAMVAKTLAHMYRTQSRIQ